MIIEFADPGFDWTPIFVTAFLALLAVVVGLIFEATYQLRGRRSNARLLAQVAFFVGLLLGVFGVGLGGSATAAGVYNSKVNTALYVALGDAGFEGISLGRESGGSDARDISAILNGKEFNGKIENLNYPKDFTFKITEIEEEK